MSRIVYAGALAHGSTSSFRAESLRRCGHDVSAIETEPGPRTTSALWWRCLNRAGVVVDTVGLNRRLIDACRAHSAEVLWVDKGTSIWPGTLKRVRALLPDCKIVTYTNDPLVLHARRSIAQLAALHHYDLCVTTKDYDIAPLRAFGARQTLLMPKTYEPMVHRPMPVTAEDRERFGGDVGFIGRYEPERGALLEALAKRGIPVRIWPWGPWPRSADAPENLIIESGPLWGDDYAKALSSFRINLGLLSRYATDTITSRSIEIPACAGFMLAERTADHHALLAEGVEAEFFSSVEELAAKAVYYLAHDDERRRMAAAGFKRIVEVCPTTESLVATILRCVGVASPSQSHSHTGFAA